MRTLEEIQESEAKKRGYRDLEDIRYDMDYEYLTSCMVEAQKEALLYFQENPINAACLIIQNEIRKDYENYTNINPFNT
jgi:hypothetical protein